MTTDLWMLVATAMLCVCMPLLYLGGRLLQPGGLAWSFGNRDTEFAIPEWTKRAIRAHQNLLESIAPFAILVLVAHVSGKANATTALGASVFFWCRAAYVPAYVSGVPYLRTVAWGGSWVGGVMVLSQLFR